MRTTAAFCLICAAACANATSGDDANRVATLDAAQDAGMCVIAPLPAAQLPHGTVQGEAASSIKRIVDDILGAQTPPLSRGETYTLPRLFCFSGGGGLPGSMPSGPGCGLEVPIDGADTGMVRIVAPDSLGSRLYDALWMAGVGYCSDPKAGTRITLSDVSVRADAIDFTDTSKYQLYSAQQNLTLRGADAKLIVDAFAAAGLDDCDEVYKVFLVCGLRPDAARCGYQRLPMERTDSGILFNTCFLGSGPPMQGGDLTPDRSLALWNAIVSGAQNAGLGVSVDAANANLINARWFSWNGEELAMLLMLGNVPNTTPATATRAPPP
jgi:hypothetical protein